MRRDARFTRNPFAGGDESGVVSGRGAEISRPVSDGKRGYSHASVSEHGGRASKDGRAVCQLVECVETFDRTVEVDNVISPNEKL